MGAPHCKAVLGPKKIVPSKAGAKMTISRELQCLNVFFCFCFLTPKRHILALNRVVLTYYP